MSQMTWAGPASTPRFWDCVIAFVALGLLSEASFLRLRISTATSSVAFIPYLASIILLGGAWAAAIAAASEFLAETLIRRKPIIKVVYNTAKKAVAVGVAGILYTSLGGVPSIDHFTLAVPAFAFAVAAFFVIDSGGTAVAIALSTSVSIQDSWRRLVGSSLVFDFLSSPLALLLAFLYTQVQLLGILVVTVPLFLLRHSYSVNLKLEEVNRDLLELMVKAIEARDPYTSGHSQRVSRVAAVLAREMGLSSRQIEQIETAALLHDVGKIYEAYAQVLQKRGRLSPEEAALMKTHPIRSADLVRTISGFRGDIEMAVRHHHENYDGSGYPDGLAGKAIPVGARIIMVADTTDAMTTDRPYRRALSYDAVVLELRKLSGSQFDPEVVQIFQNSMAVRKLIHDTQKDASRDWVQLEEKVSGLAVR